MATRTQISTFRRLRRCAGISDFDPPTLGATCKETVDEWVARLGELDVSELESAVAKKENRPKPTSSQRVRTAMLRLLSESDGPKKLRELVAALLPRADGEDDGSAPIEADGEDDGSASNETDGEELDELRERIRAKNSDWSDALDEGWDPEDLDDEDRAAVKAALDHRDSLGRKRAPKNVGAWPKLTKSKSGKHWTASPACSYYDDKNCVWPCARKKGATDKTKLCRPARVTTSKGA